MSKNKMKYYGNNGSASVIHWDLTIEVKNPDQLKSAIEWLIKKHAHFEFEMVEVDNVRYFQLHVHDFTWARNLKDFAKILEKCDYEFA